MSFHAGGQVVLSGWLPVFDTMHGIIQFHLFFFLKEFHSLIFCPVFNRNEGRSFCYCQS